jgi:hypothetical protein
MGSYSDDEEEISSGKHEPDSAMGFLHEMQQAFVRMIVGIGRFLFQTLPEWFYSLFHNIIRVTGKSLVVAAMATAWAAVVFGPAAVSYFAEWLGNRSIAITVGVWALIALTGSFRTLATLRSRGGGVGCVWAVGGLIALVAAGALLYAHVEQADKKNPNKSVPTSSYRW